MEGDLGGDGGEAAVHGLGLDAGVAEVVHVRDEDLGGVGGVGGDAGPEAGDADGGALKFAGGLDVVPLHDEQVAAQELLSGVRGVDVGAVEGLQGGDAGFGDMVCVRGLVGLVDEEGDALGLEELVVVLSGGFEVGFTEADLERSSAGGGEWRLRSTHLGWPNGLRLGGFAAAQLATLRDR